MYPEIVVDTPDRLAARAAARLGTAVTRAAQEGRRLSLAVAGGSVAAQFFPAFAASPVDWSRVDVFWTDERCVPSSDAASNWGQAARSPLFALLSVPPRAHPMPGACDDAEAAARAYAAELERSLGTPPVLDRVLLGVGPDGHVASLFPGHQASRIWGQTVVAVEGAPKPPPRRLSLTLPMLAGAGETWIAAFGIEKAAVLGTAVREASADPATRQDTDETLPIVHLLRSARRALLFLDPAAASLLPGI